VEIKPGTQPGTEIRLRGRGAPHLRRAGARGDLHVIVDVRIPTKLTREQREALEAFAAASGETGLGTGKVSVLERLKDALG
jgi:molecular chaperone DnaJ